MARTRFGNQILAGFVLLASTVSSASLFAGSATEESDPAEVGIGERLFKEPRFAQLFAAITGTEVNAPLNEGDPALSQITLKRGSLVPSPFKGKTMSCAACHLVDQAVDLPDGGIRTYADYASKSPIPGRDDEKTHTLRNSQTLVHAAVAPEERLLLHYDGELATLEDLVIAGFTGRNFGWKAEEKSEALLQIVRVIRGDDGSGELAQEFGGSYSDVFAGASTVPADFQLSEPFRLNVGTASDAEIVTRVAELVAIYMRSLQFIQSSPYDAFLRKNGLPTEPAEGETAEAYSYRLKHGVHHLKNPQWITPTDGSFKTHTQEFKFGPQEFRGLHVFLAQNQRQAPPNSDGKKIQGVGNCISCHTAPHFTDFKMHNTGETQDLYDTIHGMGAFAKLAIPTYKERSLKTVANNPFAVAPTPQNPGQVDLGAWNVFGNPALPKPQPKIARIICGDDKAESCDPTTELPKAIARFKTPSLRDLGHSEPYFHTGRHHDLSSVLEVYLRSSNRARAGILRNADPELAVISINAKDMSDLAAFLESLNEDYE